MNLANANQNPGRPLGWNQLLEETMQISNRGAFIGLTLCLALVYLSGLLFDYFGIRLYASEADQQRNFNIVLLFGAIFILVGGLLFAKRFSK